MTSNSERYACDAANAALIAEWIKTRGGILIWESVDLSDLGKSWTSPATNADGTPVNKPHWKADSKPSRHITSLADVDVTTAKEWKRFHVGVRMGGQGLSVKVTDGGSRKIRQAVAKAEAETDKPAWYEFDYGDYNNAVIMVEGGRISLTEWLERKSL